MGVFAIYCIDTVLSTNDPMSDLTSADLLFWNYKQLEKQYVGDITARSDVRLIRVEISSQSDFPLMDSTTFDTFIKIHATDAAPVFTAAYVSAHEAI